MKEIIDKVFQIDTGIELIYVLIIRENKNIGKLESYIFDYLRIINNLKI